MQENQNDQDQLQRQLDRSIFIVNGLKDYEPFNKLVELLDEECELADQSWQNCEVETNEGKKNFYGIMVHKRAVMRIKGKMQELQVEIEELQEELTEETE